MARKRYKKKRADYRKGGRVNLKHGGKPQRGDFDVADEYRNALDNWYSDPAHRDPVASQLSPQRTTPERMSEISAMPGVPSPTGIKVIDEYNVGLATPPKDNNLVATPTKTQTTVERGQDRKVVGGSKGKDYVPKVVTSGKNNDNKDTRNIYTDATEKKITTARTTAEATRKGETIVPTIPKISDAAGTKLDTTIATGDDEILVKDLEISEEFTEIEEQHFRKMLQQGGKIRIQGNLYEIKKSEHKVRNSRGDYEKPTILKKPEDWE